MPVTLARLAADTDKLLNHQAVADYSGALNGLQLANRGRVTKIAAAVDVNLPTVRAAIAAAADLLVAHHGLAWSPLLPLTGRRYELLKLCLDHNLAVYSSHLPLDLHAKLGNNILLAKALGFTVSAPFFVEKGRPIGRRVRAKISRDALRYRLCRALGADSQLIAAGPATCRVIGIVSGGAGNELARAAADGVDTFITGEGAHWTFSLAHELGVNVFYGGHYLTETFGVKALSAYLAKKYRLPWEFISVPSGL